MHILIIESLSDLQLKCSCGWSIVSTYGVTKGEAKKIHQKHIYQDFTYEWRKTHSISPAPSFTSWKANHKN